MKEKINQGKLFEYISESENGFNHNNDSKEIEARLVRSEKSSQEFAFVVKNVL